jgi:2-methylfumaryl-CoA isomerase
MSGILSGLRVVEISAFVAVPLAGLVLAQMGADVVRVDPLGGGLDSRRWPVTAEGVSLYWAGLNKGKRSVAVDIRSETGRDLVRRLVTAPGDDAGILITNVTPRWLDYQELSRERRDLIMVVLGGSPDGSVAVDYTVNAALGFPLITGDGSSPVNHVLPAWDVVAGNAVATAVLAAERHRSRTGEGQLVEMTLFDIALATIGHLGYLAEVEVNDDDRIADGNHVFGTYGRDFTTADGARVMVVALTSRQWTALTVATDTGTAMADLEARHGWDLQSEGHRYEARREISAVLEPWFAARDAVTVARVLDGARVCWGPYQTVRELLDGDPRGSIENPMLQRIEQPGIGTYLVPASPVSFGAVPGVPSQTAPVLGEDTAAVLADVLAIDDRTVIELRSSGVI